MNCRAHVAGSAEVPPCDDKSRLSSCAVDTGADCLCRSPEHLNFSQPSVELVPTREIVAHFSNGLARKAVRSA